MFQQLSYRTRRASLPILAGIALVLAGCTQPGPGHDPSVVFDPHESVNRQNHEFNRALDEKLLRPAGVGYTKAIPDDLEDSIGNFSSNLGLPGTVVNNLLQGNVEGAFRNSVRFVVNTTLGLGGLFDAAGEFGIEEIEGDFGQTLYVWGVPEGAYVELPGLGPSTERAAAGKVVDLFTNPLSYVLPSPEKYVGTAAGVASKVGERGRYADAIDSILYNSADSYSQARGIYLQNRRFKLGDGDAAEEINPFELDTQGF
ncbi:VacJ family lipoprotein [Planktotalea sp.]|uniref:MlaA family lipoprotein n=1 Tax=Planktotalea sp. TaxID=2029877 RepID=UPI003299D0EA